MLFRRKSKIERAVDAAERMIPSPRTVAALVGIATGGLALLSAASSSVSSLRQKQS